MINVDTQTNTEHTDVKLTIQLDRGVQLAVELTYEQTEDLIFNLQDCLQEIDINETTKLVENR